jgi:hypothetical protein
MKALRTFWFVACVVLITAAPGVCQTAPTQPQRGYMTGALGASFNSDTAAAFAVEFGEHINRRVQAYTAFTYFDDLLNTAARDDLAEMGSTLTRVTGSEWLLQGRDRGLAFSGGAKYLISEGGSVRPYVGGGPGVLNIRRVISERLRGDVTDAVVFAFGAPDGVIDPAKVSTFKPMAEVVAGVGFTAGRTYVDVGYRFRKVFRSPQSFNFSQFGVGVGMRF